MDKPCYSVDIIPTLSNLFGLEYDSRLLAGQDILSDAPGLVIFNDYSYLTELGRYNADTDTFTPNEGAGAGKLRPGHLLGGPVYPQLFGEDPIQ